MSAHSSNRNLSLDLLRGIAIFLVLDYHFRPVGHKFSASLLDTPLRIIGIEHFGWIGVDIFFVLSGFLVGGLLMKEWQQRGHIHSCSFLLRRALKIWPQYYLFLAVMFALHPHRAISLVGNILNIQNYTGTPLPHTWSLAVEEHFYLLLLILLSFAATKKIQPRTIFFTLAAAAVAVSIFRFVALLHGAPNIYATHMRIDGLIWGVLLAMLYHWAPHRFARLQRQRALWLIVLALCLTLICLQTTLILRILGIGCADWAGVALLLLVYRPDRPHQAWPYRILARIGFYSYGIYLWHESVIGPSASIALHIPTVQLRLAAGAMLPWLFALAFGIITTKLIELPALRLRDRLLPRPVPSPIASAPLLETIPAK